MSETLTIFEHGTCEFDWTLRDLSMLERLRQVLGVEVLRPTITGGHRALQATEQVGVVRLGARTVQILPKIFQSSAGDDERKQAREATRNLLQLLPYAGKLAIREHAIVPLLERDADWLEILTFLFATHLAEEWQRGPHRTYFEVDEETAFLKGKWHVANQIRRPERKHRFFVTYDDFSADNRLNRVFRFVVERLWLLSRSSDNRRRLGTLRQWMEDVTLVPRVTVSDAAPALITRLNQRFEPLLNLARLFLDGGSLQLLSGDTAAFALVFDMNQLFEAFVTNFIRIHRDAVLPEELRACELLPQTKGATRYLARTGGHDAFRLEPDLAFHKEGEFPLLLDAKYKRLDRSLAQVGVSEGDVYQMHAYAHRYGCRRVLLLYPQTAEHPSPLKAAFTLEDGGQLIEARTVDVRVDLAKPSERHRLRDEFKDILAGGRST